MEQPAPFVLSETIEGLLAQLQSAQDQTGDALVDLSQGLQVVMTPLDPSKHEQDRCTTDGCQPLFVSQLQAGVLQAQMQRNLVRELLAHLRLCSQEFAALSDPTPVDSFLPSPVQPFPRPPAMPKR
jgi:hypothetical protein